MNEWRTRETGKASRRLHLHFYANPVELVGDENGAVKAIRYERTKSDGTGGVVGTGEIRELEIQAFYRAVGYYSSPLADVPFDTDNGVIPNHEGQVLDDSGNVIPGMYATGWIKRGPVGLIGHTKSDAMETIAHLLADEEFWWTPSEPEESSIVDLMESRGIEYTTIAGWAALDEHEINLGEAQGRARIKVVDRNEMIEIARRD